MAPFPDHDDSDSSLQNNTHFVIHKVPNPHFDLNGWSCEIFQSPFYLILKTKQLLISRSGRGG
jgi:hypothetical protein